MKLSNAIRNSIALLVAVLLMGLAAYWYEYRPQKEWTVTEGSLWYEDTEHGFVFAYSKDFDVNVRDSDHWATQYAGVSVDHYLSIRDIVSEEKPNNSAFVYAMRGGSVDAFIQSLEQNVKGAKLESRTQESNGDFNITKLVSTTEQPETLKTHYVFESKGYLIIFSVFLGEEEHLPEIINSIKQLK
jgi:hypothetical protein